MKLLKIALRNTMRNKRRFFITMISILFAVFVSSMLKGMVAETQGELKGNITDTQTGDLQVFKKGYSKALSTSPINMRMKEGSAEVAFIKNLEGVEASASRLKLSGMVSNGPQSAPFVAIAFEPEEFKKVCPKYGDNIKWGKAIQPRDVDGIVMSEQLAKSFNITEGEYVTLLTRTVHGGLNTVSVKVRGSFSQMMMGDSRIVYMNIKTAQKLLDIGNEATEIVIRVKDNYSVEKVRKNVEKTAEEKKYDVEILSWLEIMPFFKNVMSIQNVMIFIVSAILFVLVVSTVINTIQMSVFERIKEIGMMKALGMKSKKILMLFLYEGVIYGSMGGIAGIVLSQIVVVIIKLSGGIVYTFPMKFGASQPWYVIPEISMGFRCIVFVMAILTGVIASIYPARKACKIAIVDTLHKRMMYK